MIEIRSKFDGEIIYVVDVKTLIGTNLEDAHLDFTNLEGANRGVANPQS